MSNLFFDSLSSVISTRVRRHSFPFSKAIPDIRVCRVELLLSKIVISHDSFTLFVNTFPKNSLKTGFVSFETKKPKRLPNNFNLSIPIIWDPTRFNLEISPSCESTRNPTGAKSYNELYSLYSLSVSLISECALFNSWFCISSST